MAPGCCFATGELLFLISSSCSDYPRTCAIYFLCDLMPVGIRFCGGREQGTGGYTILRHFPLGRPVWVHAGCVWTMQRARRSFMATLSKGTRDKKTGDDVLLVEG